MAGSGDSARPGRPLSEDFLSPGAKVVDFSAMEQVLAKLQFAVFDAKAFQQVVNGPALAAANAAIAKSLGDYSRLNVTGTRFAAVAAKLNASFADVPPDTTAAMRQLAADSFRVGPNLAAVVNSITLQTDFVKDLSTSLSMSPTLRAAFKSVLDAAPHAAEVAARGDRVAQVKPAAVAALTDTIASLSDDPSLPELLERMQPQQFALFMVAITATPIVAAWLVADGDNRGAVVVVLGLLYALMTLSVAPPPENG